MKFIHIHSAIDLPFGANPYLVVSGSDDERITFDFKHIHETTGHVPATIALSSAAVYEILEGKGVSVSRTDDVIEFRPRGDELTIWIESDRGNAEFSVWLSELALAWNLLSRRQRLQNA